MMPVYMKNLYPKILGPALILISVSILSPAAATENPRFARAEIPTPVLNTADFHSVFGGANGRTLKRDFSGLIRAVEFIALPGTVFKIEDTYRIQGTLIYRVRTAEYPPQKTGLYVDSRFVSVSHSPLPPRAKTLPLKSQILEKLASNQGALYVWGGNTARGTPELLQFYPPSGNIPPEVKNMWALRGLDCSGLLYEAADGMTPRNTSDLITFGKPVLIEGLSAAKIANKLQPLDLITWKGHVIIVLDQKHTIESCMGCSPRGGVTVRKLRSVLEEVMRTRTPANGYSSEDQKPFVIRRWYPSN